MTEQKDHNLDLNTPVQFIKGVGPRRAQTFAQLGVNTLADLLEYFPRDWVFMPEPIKISDVRPKQTATIVGLVEQTDFQPYRRTPMFEAVVADDTAACRIIWFHGGYLKSKLQPGKIIMASGKFTLYKHQLQVTNPKSIILDSPDQIGPDFFNGPVYPASAKLSSTQIKRIITPLLKDTPEFVPEFYEPDFLKKANLITRPDAFKQIHAPDNEDQLSRAKRRLKYDELFLMQLGLALKRHQAQNAATAQMKLSDKIDSRIRKRFPFLLTEDQNTVINEIASDMARTTPMNRLLQGDVGSGKTVVALYAALLAVANKTQVAIMAPTEILADQHMTSIERFLKNSKVTRTLITGAVTGKKREQTVKKISTGQIDIVVGTVALLNEKIDFANLGLVIIDEQHKFGVHQRAGLRKGKTPHCLVMTATPIPRTLAMTAFGDLDVSTIKHSPPGRGEVITKWVQPHDRPKALDFIRQRLKAKKQAYFVYPRIESEDKTETKAAIDEHKTLSREFGEFNVVLLHGQMPADRKNRIMNDFRAGKINVLVSTIVIEVGIDVPNATIMVIENANRFGLAQLHQLRGRIGRGQSKSYCLLFAETEDETAKSRLEIMTRSNDGFEIAEHDLKLRGPGELFSARQHGLPDLKIANIIDDFELLTLARRNAFEMVSDDPVLAKAGNRNIRAALIDKFGAKITLADIA
jgi:ATP-dependent DNA helicase RecG